MIEGQAIVEFPFIHETDDHAARRGVRGADWNSKDLRANKAIYLYRAVFDVKRYDSIEFFDKVWDIQLRCILSAFFRR